MVMSQKDYTNIGNWYQPAKAGGVFKALSDMGEEDRQFKLFSERQKPVVFFYFRGKNNQTEGITKNDSPADPNDQQ